MKSKDRKLGAPFLKYYFIVFAVVLLFSIFAATRDHEPYDCMPWPLTSPLLQKECIPWVTPSPIPSWVCP